MCPFQDKGDVARLMDHLMGPLYSNYDGTRTVLVRQARDLLVCEYLGNIARFEEEFCIPAAQLLKAMKDQVEKVRFSFFLYLNFLLKILIKNLLEFSNKIELNICISLYQSISDSYYFYLSSCYKLKWQTLTCYVELFNI